MATYTYRSWPAPIVLDLNDYAGYLYSDHLQGCVSKEMPIPEQEEIQHFIETGESSPEMERFVKAMRDLVNDINQEAFLEMETEAMMEMIPEELQ